MRSLQQQMPPAGQWGPGPPGPGGAGPGLGPSPGAGPSDANQVSNWQMASPTLQLFVLEGMSHVKCKCIDHLHCSM